MLIEQQILHMEVKCLNGHKEIYRLEGLSLIHAKQYASLLDGTSPFYVHPPGDGSMIGKCNIYNAPIEAIIKG